MGMSITDNPARRRNPLRSRTAIAVAAAAVASLVSATAPASAQDNTFRCDPGFYQVISGQLAELDPATETYDTIGPDHSNYNAMGYRIADGFLYGISGTTLFRVDNTGARTTVANLDFPGGSYTGDFDDEGLLNISRGGSDWYKVDVDTLEMTAIPEFTRHTAVADITNVHGVFYGVSSGGSLFSYDQTTLETREIGAISGLPTTSKAYGAAWSTAGGNLYVGRNSGEIYQITGYTTSTPTASLVGRAPATNSNDGASCSLAVPIPGLDDVDGAPSESEPRTEEAKEAAQQYEDNYDEISATFTPMEEEPEPEPEPEPTDESTFTIDDAGMGTGPSCVPGGDVDRPERGPVENLTTVSESTQLYATNFGPGSLDEWSIRSGSWSSEVGALKQNNICGFDYTVLLNDFAVQDFRWDATFNGLSDVNQGGVIFHHASTRSRSGAVVVDLADEGKSIRWGQYDALGYYQSLGSAPIAAPATGQNVTLSVEVHGNDVTVSLDGAVVGSFTSTESAGMVGLISSVSQVAFTDVSLVALPAVEATEELTS